MKYLFFKSPIYGARLALSIGFFGIGLYQVFFSLATAAVALPLSGNNRAIFFLRVAPESTLETTLAPK